MKIRTKDDLQQIRAKLYDHLYNPPVLKINVGMASCGIAAGAKDTYQRALELYKDKDVLVAGTGCLGFCEQEPMVEILAPDKPRLVYRHVTEEKIEEIVEAYQKGEYLEKFVYGQITSPHSILD
ncbi:(2Fe-2S) ferredoxin domain-containing protein, partial [bacterium]|nr:(2Fe-2S) ferredoxin domain-containing protein [bacterium]